VSRALAAAMHPGTRIPTAFRALILDMDGVLLDTERIWGLAEAALCDRYGVDYGPADEAATHGVLIVEACQHYARRFGLTDADAPRLERELLDLMATELEGKVPPLPGAVELLDAVAPTIKLAVASNSRREVVDRALERAGLADRFAVVVSADDVPRPKPAPDLYLEACRLLAVEPSAALAIEDSRVGAAAALAGGLACYLLAPEPPSTDLPVTGWITSLTELLADS
jgi:HAD superfamily hydrolase (TIGR01509 family)